MVVFVLYITKQNFFMNSTQAIKYLDLSALQRSFSIPRKIAKALQKAKRAIGRNVRKTFEAIGKLSKGESKCEFLISDNEIFIVRNKRR